MKKDTTRSIELCTESLYSWLNISLKFEPACSLIFLTMTFITLPVVETQTNEDFNCTFLDVLAKTLFVTVQLMFQII